MFRRVLAVGALATAAAVLAGTLSHPARSVAPTEVARGEVEQLSASGCGVERWPIKTLTDAAARNVVLRSRASTVEELRALPNPGAGFSTPRLHGPETTTYRARVRLVELKTEPDLDIHLVVASLATRRKMIAEFPSPTCTKGARGRSLMTRARNALIAACGPSRSSWRRLTGTATIAGVGFFDVLHGQRGVAPNGIELHPVTALRVRCR
ncbi:MAG: hypothetical protein M3R70_14165 [Actinomycetota bacterium]|nr:hypothetical protein [Actinomycetota bacterium]